MIKKLRENKKGFTLVELIVVLVILAILAALLIPALTGYIDKAKEKSIIAETRQVVMAAQTLADEIYGTKDLSDTSNVTFAESGANVKFEDVTKLAEVNGTIKTITATGGAIEKVEYEKSGKTCTYTKTADAATGTYNVVPTQAEGGSGN